MAGPVFFRPGQVYLVTQSGEVKTSAYADAATGAGLADDGVPDGEVEDAFAVRSWKQVD